MKTGVARQFIKASTILVGRGLRAVGDGVVEVADGNIVAVGGSSEVSIPEGAEILEFPRETLVPGFIDAHVHIGFFDPAEVLRAGITTARDLAWPPDIIFPLMRRSADEDFDGPQILAAGPMLTAPGGYPLNAAWAPDGTGLAIDSADEVPGVTAHLLAEKAAIVKVALNPDVGPVLGPRVLGAIVSEAHRAGLRVTGHVAGVKELAKALEAGVDELAHMLMGHEEIPQPLIEDMVSSGMTVVPTLAIRRSAERRVAVSNLRRFLEAGGRAVYGTDLGNEGVSPVDRAEMKLMTKAGMSPEDVLRSATVDAAAWLGLEDRGAIEVGKRADLVAVEGTSSVREMSRVKAVFRAGKPVRRT